MFAIDITDLLKDYPAAEAPDPYTYPDFACPVEAPTPFEQAVRKAMRLAIHAASLAGEAVEAQVKLRVSNPTDFVAEVSAITGGEVYSLGSIYVEQHGGPRDGERVYETVAIRWRHTTRNEHTYLPVIVLVGPKSA